MCGRFYIEDDAPEELLILMNRAQLNARKRMPALELKRGEIRPSECVAVIALNRTLQPSAFAMQWGFPMDQQRVINARSETAAERPLFRESMQARRCLIPVSGYLEWDHRQKLHSKYRFYAPGAQVMYLAGLYRLEGAASLPTFTILTRAAAPEIACFHDRMPVILPPELHRDWLNRDASAQNVLRQAQTNVAWQNAEASSQLVMDIASL